MRSRIRKRLKALGWFLLAAFFLLAVFFADRISGIGVLLVLAAVFFASGLWAVWRIRGDGPQGRMP